MLFGIRRVELHQDDCLTVLRLMPDGFVDSIVTDPPYGIAYRPKRKGMRPILNDRRPFIWWLGDAYSVLRRGGSLVCFCRWDVQETFRMAIKAAGFTVRSQVVWDRVAHGAGDCRQTFAPQHEVLWFATRGPYRFPGGRPRSLFRFKRVAGRLQVHPTQKPVALMQELVRAVAPRGGLVLDPFMGSGSTGVAALEEGRRFIGIEADPAYVRTARKRIQEVLRGGAT